MCGDYIAPQMSEARSGKALIDASRPFAKEDRAKSIFHVVTTFGLIAALVAVAAMSTLPWYVRLIASAFNGFVVVRGFILYHDYLHGAILRNSPIAKAVFYLYGVLLLTPPNVWRQTHNYHHAHTAKIVGSHVGSYAMITVDMWKAASPSERLMYKIIRHPFTIAIGYVTIFMYGMCISAFRRNPKKNWDSLLAIIVHLALATTLYVVFGWQTMLFTLVLPLVIACAAGAYLFYAQHNFPDIEVQPRETWEYTRAALESSSFMRTGPLMQWLTGNIGFHHVHHLNPSIPFYRLPEAMAEIPELQHPHETSLSPKDIVACFELKLWDPNLGKMVGYPAD